MGPLGEADRVRFGADANGVGNASNNDSVDHNCQETFPD